MKTLTLFYLRACPYCIKAEKAIKELCAEDLRYRSVSFDWVEESIHPEIADRYDYYYVPTVFDGSVKLYEADPRQDYASIKASLKAVMDRYAKQQGSEG